MKHQNKYHISSLVLTLISFSVLPESNGYPSNNMMFRGKVTKDYSSIDCNRCVPDIQAQLGKMSNDDVGLTFYMNGAPSLSSSLHWQGIQRTRNDPFLIITRNDEFNGSRRGAAFAIVHFSSRNKSGFRLNSNRYLPAPPGNDKVVKYVTIGERYKHAGGIQLCGNLLAIPLEKPENDRLPSGKIIFYDVSNPLYPAKLNCSINLPSCAGACALTKLSDGRFLCVVHGRNSGKSLDFFISSDSNWRSMNFSLFHSWDYDKDGVVDRGGDDNWPTDYIWYAAYQNIALITQCNGDLYLIGMHNHYTAGSGADWVDLYKVFILHSKVQLQKVFKKHMYCDFCNFSAASGVYIDPYGRIIVYAIEKDNEGNITELGEF